MRARPVKIRLGQGRLGKKCWSGAINPLCRTSEEDDCLVDLQGPDRRWDQCLHSSYEVEHWSDVVALGEVEVIEVGDPSDRAPGE